MTRVRNRVRELREARGLSKSDLGRLAGVTAAAVTHIENGRNEPTYATASKLSRALGVAIGEAFWVEEDPEEPKAPAPLMIGTDSARTHTRALAG